MSPKRTDWLLPLALAAGQVGVWPGPALFRQPAAVIALILAVTAVVTVALGFRRVRPVTTLIVTDLAVTAGALALTPLGADSDSLVDVLSVTPLVALFSVAAWTGVRTTLAATALPLLTTGVGYALAPGSYSEGESGTGLVLLLVTDALGTALVALFGHRRQVWRRGREDARRLLAEAEAARTRAAHSERHRLARELHDVSAHHLTAIVVTVTAASRLAATRPELAADALTFSAQAARRTLDTLLDLVAVMRGADATGDLPTRVAGLAAEFARLGQPVTADCVRCDDLPAPVADTAFAVVREALTNTVRYAPGAAVTVRVAVAAAGDAVEVTVGNGPAARASDADGVGSGSGLDGARARAEQLGGTLTAGPSPDGGWRVTARLPRDARLPSAAPGDRLKRAWQGRAASVGGHLTDALIMVLLAIGSVSISLVEPGFYSGGAVALLVLHAAPLAWAHRAPWRVLGAVLTVLLGWGVLCAAGVLPAASLSAMMIGGLVEVYAVYAVAAHGRGRSEWTWISAFGTAAMVGLAAGIGAARSGATVDEPSGPVAFGAFVTVVAGVLSVPPLIMAWGAGAAWRRRNARLRARERDVVAAAAVSADGEALAERWRIAAELRSTVLDRATAVLTAATAPPGDPDTAARLTEVQAAARATLAAMRDLLGNLRGGATHDPGPETGPQPTAAQIGALCEAQRAAGRPVMLRYATPLPALPPGVDVSAYRLVEAALELPGGPLEIVLGVTGGLRILLNRIPALTDPRTAAGLRGRVDAVSGVMTVHPAGETDIWLPLTVSVSEEVPSSPSV